MNTTAMIGSNGVIADEGVATCGFKVVADTIMIFSSSPNCCPPNKLSRLPPEFLWTEDEASDIRADCSVWHLRLLTRPGWSGRP